MTACEIQLKTDITDFISLDARHAGLSQEQFFDMAYPSSFYKGT